MIFKYIAYQIYRLIKFAIVTGLWIFGLGLLIWYPLRWWPGDRLAPVQLLNYLAPWLLLALLPAVITAAVFKRLWLGLTLVIPTVLILFTYAPLFLPRSSVALADNNHYKVMSYNIWQNNKNLPASIDLIIRENPDILLLQEARPNVAKRIQADWQAIYPNRLLHLEYDIKMKQAIISRFPITPLHNEFNEGRAQKVIINTPGGPLNVWNVHTSQPILWRKHYRQVERLANSIDRTSGPLLVAGDFNTTEQAEVYSLIDSRLQNAHWNAGWGFGFSFPAHRPNVRGVRVPVSVIRIDHIFHNEALFTHTAGTLSEAGGSDHYPIVAELSLIN